jgi:TolB-like protein/Flp pilus assembly protein TadD
MSLPRFVFQTPVATPSIHVHHKGLIVYKRTRTNHMERGANMTAEPVDTPDTSAPVSVFLSYSREDRPRALTVIKALEGQGFSVWWDGLLEGGSAFARTTETALETSDAVVVLWSETSVQSHWVRDEATHGRDRGCMVPVSLDGSVPPLGFRQIQFVDLSKWRAKHNAPEIAELARAIRATAANPGHQLAFKTNKAVHHPTRRTLLIAGGAAAATLGGGLIVWKMGLLGGTAPGNSIAVLPFKNMSGDAAQAYFSDGLAEEVRTTLSRNALLRVMAPTSSNIFRDHSESAPDIAAKLGVAFLLEGSVRRVGALVRITAELIEGSSGFSRWADSFDRDVKDIFAVQSEIAATVASALTAHVTPPNTKADLGSTTNVEAFDAYLKGKAFATLSAGEASDRAALAQFDKAIAADSGYAKAHAARSRALTVIANQYAVEAEFQPLYGAAIVAAKRTITLAPDLADGYSVLGFALSQGELDIRGARAPYDRSRALGAGDALIMGRFAGFCAWTGRAKEAAEAISRALTLDPLNPLIHRAAGSISIAAHQFAAAIPELEKAIALNPQISTAHGLIGDCLYHLGKLKDARQAYLSEKNELGRYSGLAIVEAKLGNIPAARQAMSILTNDLDIGTIYQQAQVLAQWGDRDGAIAKLENARKIGDSGMIYARNDTMLDPVRSDARFILLLKTMGFD